MTQPDDSIQDRLNALSAEIGRRRKAGLPAADLLAEHRALRESLPAQTPPRTAQQTPYLEETRDITSPELHAEWDALLATSGALSPSMSWEWLNAWHTCFAQGRDIRVLSVRERPSERLVGLLPLVHVSPLHVSWRHEGYLPCRHLAPCGTRLGAEVDYTHPLLAQDTDRDAVARLLVEALAGKGLPFVANHWDTGDASAQAFLRVALDQGFQITTAPRSVAYDTLPSSFDAFAQQLPTATRRNRTRYYERQGWLQDGEFTLLTFRDLDGILAQFPVIERFNRATHGAFSIWRLPWYVEFVRSCVRASSGQGWPIAWTLYRGRDPVASMLGWVMGGNCSVSALTHDRACRDVEPGHILLTRAIGDLIGLGVRRLDMHTAEGYKTHYLRQRRTRLDPLLLCPPGVSPDWAIAAMSGVSGLRRLAKSALTRGSRTVRAAD